MKLNGKRTHGEIRLYIHPPSTFSGRPVLLADGDFPNGDKPGRAMPDERCHETTSRRLNFTNRSPTLSESADNIYFRLLSPFTDVFCFFADDVGKFKSIVQRLALWLDLGQPSTLPKSTRPRILIVAEREKGADVASDLRAFKQMLREETTIDISEQFSDIALLSLETRKKGLSNIARHRKLFEHLLNYSDQVREARINTQTLFSAHHFSAFFHYALNHVAMTSVEPFNFIAASRIEKPIPINMQDHLVDFLHNIKSPQKLKLFAIPVIASSFLLDNYVPDMHFFCPSEVFYTLYKELCHQVCRRGVLAHEGSRHIILPSGFVKLIEEEFIKQVEALADRPDISSTEWHLEKFSPFKSDWLTIHSDNTCYVCLGERPQYGLPCGHILCDNCVRKFGAKTDIWTFDIHECFLCKVETPGIRIKFKPPTATPRLLSIDGGGVRGIIPLIFLQVLEERIGLPCPVQENFHFAFGTSSGGITVLALCHNGWSVEDCIDYFERFAKQAFKLHHFAYFGWLSWIQAVLISLITDGIYSVGKLEAVLQETFGSEKNILDYSSATASGTKIGITVSTMKPEPFIFSNYNGLGKRKNKKYEKYGVLLGNARVWEIARSTSAAPGIFMPKSISGFGKFQDGGLKHNNPIRLALREIKALSPNDPSIKRTSLKVSLGTGKARDSESEMHGSSTWWKDMWIFRLFRALWSTMDEEENGDVFDRKEQERFGRETKAGEKRRRGEYFRFNVEFIGQEPRLDDTNKMAEMKALAREAILHSQSKELDRLVHCIIAEFFVFELELENLPRKENGRYLCTGFILCCHRAGTPAFEALLRRLAKSSAKFLLKGRALPGSIQGRSCIARDGNFRKRVCFEVSSREEISSIQLQERGSESYDISGSPFSINWLIEAQGFGQPFGRSDGLKRKPKDSEVVSLRKRQRIS